MMVPFQQYLPSIVADNIEDSVECFLNQQNACFPIDAHSKCCCSLTEPHMGRSTRLWDGPIHCARSGITVAHAIVAGFGGRLFFPDVVFPLVVPLLSYARGTPGPPNLATSAGSTRRTAEPAVCLTFHRHVNNVCSSARPRDEGKLIKSQGVHLRL